MIRLRFPARPLLASQAFATLLLAAQPAWAPGDRPDTRPKVGTAPPDVFGKAGVFSPSYWVSKDAYAHARAAALPEDARLKPQPAGGMCQFKLRLSMAAEVDAASVAASALLQVSARAVCRQRECGVTSCCS